RSMGCPNGLAMDDRMVTHRSNTPRIPTRSEANNKTSPSAVMLGLHSVAELLIVGHRLVTLENGWAVVCRVATHTSSPPRPLGGSETRQSDSLSAAIAVPSLPARLPQRTPAVGAEEVGQ